MEVDKIFHDGRWWYIVGYDTIGKQILRSVNLSDNDIKLIWPSKRYAVIRYCDPATGSIKEIMRKDHSWLR